MAKNKLSVLGLGYALATVSAICALVLGLSAWLFGYGVELVNVLSSIYIGFAPTFWGMIIGIVLMAIDGFIGGLLIAYFYNKFQK